MIDKDKDIDYVLRTGLSPSWYCYVHNFLIDKDKEIERLKEELKSIKSNYKIQLEYDENLQQRIDKAIEYIESTQKFNKGCDINIILNKDYLLKILGGDE